MLTSIVKETLRHSPHGTAKDHEMLTQVRDRSTYVELGHEAVQASADTEGITTPVNMSSEVTQHALDRVAQQPPTEGEATRN